ncbi:type II toxin-antitoxin system HicA family toxin [Candidatus Gottesmanbacteria bacterium]|nr:type II toxin-antitoxin system HicA family toxin [Candidatus Gottesmanbacteria bacterium]
MPKLPVIKPKEILRKYKRLGFIEDHTTGSHIILYHPMSKRRAVIPYHLRDIPKGTLTFILRESGITKDEFLKA